MAAACASNIARLQRQGKIDQLLEALNYEKDAAIRAEAAAALVDLDAAGAIDPLSARLSDQVPAVRQTAALALCKIRDTRIIDSTILLLQEEDAEI